MGLEISPQIKTNNAWKDVIWKLSQSKWTAMIQVTVAFKDFTNAPKCLMNVKEFLLMMWCVDIFHYPVPQKNFQQINSFRTVMGGSCGLINSILHNNLQLAIDISLQTNSIFYTSP
jgi:hypothetical protein